MAMASQKSHSPEARPASSLPTPAEVAKRRPCVHAVTGAVSAAFVADVLLALGAEPALTHYPPELPEMLAHADALLVNMGQPDEARIQAARTAAQLAAQRRLPWVLDPAHAHASPPRLARVRQLLQLKPAVFKPNRAELTVLANALAIRPDAESLPDTVAGAALPDHAPAALALARRLKTVVLTTGKTDLVTDGHRLLAVTGGHPHMHRSVAFGCALGASVAAFLAIAPPLQAAAAAAAAFDRAAAIAAQKAKGPASFRIAFIDALAAQADSTDTTGKEGTP